MSRSYMQKLSQFIEFESRSRKCFSCKSEIVCGGGCYFKELAYGKICEPENIINNEIPIILKYASRG